MTADLPLWKYFFKSFSNVVTFSMLQLPGLALLVLILVFVQRWVDLPAWVSWGSIGIWVVKDAILYPFVWRAYDSGIVCKA